MEKLQKMRLPLEQSSCRSFNCIVNCVDMRIMFIFIYILHDTDFTTVHIEVWPENVEAALDCLDLGQRKTDFIRSQCGVQRWHASRKSRTSHFIVGGGGGGGDENFEKHENLYAPTDC